MLVLVFLNITSSFIFDAPAYVHQASQKVKVVDSSTSPFL